MTLCRIDYCVSVLTRKTKILYPVYIWTLLKTSRNNATAGPHRVRAFNIRCILFNYGIKYSVITDPGILGLGRKIADIGWNMLGVLGLCSQRGLGADWSGENFSISLEVKI